MKKILFVVLLLAGFAGASHDLYAQTKITPWHRGISYTPTPQTTGPSGDTLLFIGTYSLIDNYGVRIDSFAVRVGNQDSLRQALVLRLKNAFGTYTDSASVTHLGGDLIYDATAAGQAHYPYFLIRAALGDKLLTAVQAEIWIRLHKVGTEVASSGKKANIQVTTNK